MPKLRKKLLFFFFFYTYKEIIVIIFSFGCVSFRQCQIQAQ